MIEGFKSPVLKLPVSDRDHILGPSDAPVILVEYGDFECPLCGRAYPVMKQLISELGDKLRFVFRNFPLKTIHPNSWDAALAAEAAGKQGKFWEMHNILFENQERLEKKDLVEYARAALIDVNIFNEDFISESLHNKVREDFRSGVLSGVNGTPSFFINGSRYDGTYYHWDLSKAIERALSKE